ncbi:MAG: hypothetical protein FJ286_15690 [Planctomycetes bacterium]|nr:hypothetical protein [Planctomycetota bacterium]
MTAKIPDTLESLMTAYPNLCATGWRQPKATDSEFAALRDELAQAGDKVELCRRMFRDTRFLKKWHGLWAAYGIKHRAENWDFQFDPVLFPPRRCYNGYVYQGVAVAAALLEGFTVIPHPSGAPGSDIAVPRPPRGPRRAGRRANQAEGGPRRFVNP